ncbi:MAG: MFS transporter [bacterium]
MPTETQPHYSYLDHKARREINELYLTFIIQQFARSMFSLFEPIYFISLGLSILQVIMFYGFVAFFYFLLLPFGAKMSAHFGFEHNIFYSIPILIGYFIVLYMLQFYLWLLPLAMFLLVFFRTIFWPAYHGDLAFYGSQDQRGKEIGKLKSLVLTVTIAAPFLGGLILKISNFSTLFVIVAILLFISIIPIFTTKEKFTPSKFSYTKAYKRLFKKENRRRVLGYMGVAEDFMTCILWPVFIYLVVQDTFALGSIVAFSTLITVLIMLAVGKQADKKKNILKTGSIVYFVVLIVKVFIRSAPQAFFIDVFSRTARNSIGIPVMASAYGHASRHGVMKGVNLFQLSLNLGRILAAIICFIIVYYTDNLAYVFIPAAFYSLLYLFLNEKEEYVSETK